MTAPRFRIAISLVAIVALAVPASAAAWKYKFQDFFDTSGSAASASVIKAKRCHGGKLGNYKFASRVASIAEDHELELEVLAKLPVTEKFKPLKDVEVSVQAVGFDPALIDQMVQATSQFWDGVSARWKPGKLTFKHPELVIFGNQVLAAGKNTVDFKPKPGC